MIQALNTALEDYKAGMMHHHRLCLVYQVATRDQQEALDEQIEAALDCWAEAERCYIQQLEVALRAQ